MIRVTIDMWPQGDERRAYRLGALDIYNDGTSRRATIGHYAARFYNKKGSVLKRDCRVENWPRLRRSIFALVREVIARAGY